MMDAADIPLTMTVPEFGKLVYGLGRYASYDAANRGDFPTIKVGRFKRVPVRIALRPLLAEAGRDTAELDSVLARLGKAGSVKSAA
jgi:hypothetical protein